MCQKVHFKETKYSVSISNLFEEGLRDSVGDCDLMFMVKEGCSWGLRESGDLTSTGQKSPGRSGSTELMSVDGQCVSAVLVGGKCFYKWLLLYRHVHTNGSTQHNTFTVSSFCMAGEVSM